MSLTNSSWANADIGGIGVAFVAAICLEFKWWTFLDASFSPSFLISSSRNPLYFSSCWLPIYLVLTQKCLLSTITFDSQSSSSFFFSAYSSATMSSPLINTVLKNSFLENVVTPLTFYMKLGLPSSWGLYTLSCIFSRVISFWYR